MTRWTPFGRKRSHFELFHLARNTNYAQRMVVHRPLLQAVFTAYVPSALFRALAATDHRPLFERVRTRHRQ